MKNKFLVLLLALVMVLGAVACSNKKTNENTNNTANKEEDVADKVVDENYYNVYTKNYESSIVPLEESYYIYGDVDSAEKYYKDHDYPGNKEYLQEVKDALIDSKAKVQDFIDNMEKEGTSDNDKVNKLNKEIEKDSLDLGKGYRIGHSYFTPTEEIKDVNKWYKMIIKMEIEPLIREYWFDKSDEEIQPKVDDLLND